MIIDRELLQRLLVEPGHITATQLDSVVGKSEQTHKHLLQILVEDGYISDTNLGRTIADNFGYKFIDLTQEVIPRDLLLIIPEAVAREQHIVAYYEDTTVVHVATTQPDNYELIQFLKKKTGKHVDVSYATYLGISEALRSYKSDLRLQVQKLVDTLEQDPRNESSIIELVNLILEYSYDSGTSDIHIEPLENSSIVRFRIDGVLHEVVSYPKTLHEQVIFRIKIMSRLRTDEHAATQDGRFEYKKDSIKFDVRVSLVPTVQGENIVMRLLTSEGAHQVNLHDLGYSDNHAAILKRAIEKPHGMILSVGPTGSGKSTTLYTILQMLNTPDVNIMTIEDPVEYNIENIQQIPVNLKKNVTFSTGLRSIVRQDPDIVMVGEIRDAETAGIAVNAAMTGHLLLSTLHANDASTTFPRLIDLGVEPFLLASSLNIVIAQRLVRRICDKCRESYPITPEEKLVIEQSAELTIKIQELSKGKSLSDIRFYRGRKCDDCNNTGYRGRIGIFEILEINQDIRSLIVQKSSADVIETKARELGMHSMASDGLEKIFQGVTTLEEVILATKT
ncbi:MAG: type II/IV secretion system protein [Candidatus Pacebacteria bacterium]|nr:type II/IV secretion system protein [Candidatus Paceibacterota bacterium]